MKFKAICQNLFYINAVYGSYLQFIKENRRIFKLSIKHFEVMNMNEVYSGMFKHVFEPIPESFCVPENERRFVIKFYLTGVFAIVMEWLDGDCKEDIGLIVKIVNDCVLKAKYIPTEH